MTTSRPRETQVHFINFFSRSTGGKSPPLTIGLGGGGIFSPKIAKDLVTILSKIAKDLVTIAGFG